MVEIINFEYKDYNEYYLKIGNDSFNYSVYSGVTLDKEPDDKTIEYYYRIKNTDDYFKIDETYGGDASIINKQYQSIVDNVNLLTGSRGKSYFKEIPNKHVILYMETDHLHEIGKYMLNKTFRERFSPINFINSKVNNKKDVSDTIRNNFLWLNKSFEGIEEMYKNIKNEKGSPSDIDSSLQQPLEQGINEKGSPSDIDSSLQQPLEQGINERFDILEQKIENNRTNMDNGFVMLKKLINKKHEETVNKLSDTLNLNFKVLKQSVRKDINRIENKLTDMKNDLLKNFEKEKIIFLKAQEKFWNQIIKEDEENHISKNWFIKSLKNNKIKKPSFEQAEKIMNTYFNINTEIRSDTATMAGIKQVEAFNRGDGSSTSSNASMEKISQNYIKYIRKEEINKKNMLKELICIIFKYESTDELHVKVNEWIDKEDEKMTKKINECNPQGNEEEKEKAIKTKKEKILNDKKYDMFKLLSTFMDQIINIENKSGRKSPTSGRNSPMNGRNTPTTQENIIRGLAKISRRNTMPPTLSNDRKEVYKSPLKF